MDNLAIARVLREIADLLEIKNDNPFKIRAYRNGADIVANHPHDLATLDASGLREIPGIGKDLAARIREIGETGDAEFHRELIAEFPPTVLDLLQLQGVGPKTVAMLYRDLAIRTLDELERAATDGTSGAATPDDICCPMRTTRRRRWSPFCASARPPPTSRRSAACGEDATPAEISTSSRRVRIDR